MAQQSKKHLKSDLKDINAMDNLIEELFSMAERLDKENFLATATLGSLSTVAAPSGKKNNSNSSGKKNSAGKIGEQESGSFVLENEDRNCIALSDTTIHGITENLRKRFQAGQFFNQMAGSNQVYATSSGLSGTDIGIGEDVIFVNPGSTSFYYSDKVVRLYGSIKDLHATPPHLFRQVLACHRRAYDHNIDQCLIFSGCTGSGKTECLKQAIHFLTWIKPSTIADRILLVHRILSVLGSAASQNCRSRTRMGYFLDCSLDFKGDLTDLAVSPIMIETGVMSTKSNPLVSHSGYHIFYALLYGACLHTLKTLKLQRNVNNYAILRRCIESSSCGADQTLSSDWGKSTFAQIEDAMTKLDLSQTEQTTIWLVLSIILKLGNLYFQATVNLDGTPGCILHQEYGAAYQYPAHSVLENPDKVVRINIQLHEICQLLGCDSGVLHSVLTSRCVTYSASRTFHSEDEDQISARVEFSAEEAQNHLDVICRAIYSRLVNWLIRKLNTSSLKKLSETHRFKQIGFLDFPGYTDSLEVNHFDQLLCNYAQERIHWFLLSTKLKEQQKLYILEGLQWNPMGVNENSSIVSEQLESCMSLLDQASLDVAQNSGFFSKLKKSNIASTSESMISLDHKNGLFIVQHYWKSEPYNAEGFVQKNLESIAPECSKIFYTSKTCVLMQQLFPEGAKKQVQTPSQIKKRLSASAQCKLSVNAIISALKDRQVTSVFSLKSNSLQRANLFDAEIVKKQVESLSLSELTTVRKAGFCWGQSYQDAYARYRMLSEDTWPYCHATARQGLQMVLQKHNIETKTYSLGRSNVFWRSYETVWYLDHHREVELHRLARMIQRAFRKYYRLYGTHRLDKAQIIIAAYYRSYRTRKDFLRKRNACILIAAYFKGWKKKCYLKRLGSCLPSESPTCTVWPICAPRNCTTADAYIRILFHRWRCRKFRSKIDQQGYFKMREKLAASLIFRHKKTGYPFTVGHPFRGDYVRLRQNPKWRRISLDTSDEYVVFADMVSKIHRSSGKVSTMLLVVSTAGVLILDHRTLTVKHRAPVEEIQKISLSPHADTLAVFHLGKSTSLSRKSGDFLLECRHIIELVAKLYLVIQNSTGKPPLVEINSTIIMECDQDRLELIFRPPGSTTTEDVVEVEDLSSKLTSCFQTSPSGNVRYATTSPTTAGNLAVKMASAAVAGTSSGESTATPSVMSYTAADVGTPNKRMKFVRRGNQIEVLF